jgi:hypothetical protein
MRRLLLTVAHRMIRQQKEERIAEVKQIRISSQLKHRRPVT